MEFPEQNRSGFAAVLRQSDIGSEVKHFHDHLHYLLIAYQNSSGEKLTHYRYAYRFV